MKNNIIEVNNLSKNYGSVKAVDNISFQVKEGELFAFLGQNGAGKSTTINILCGILTKDNGTIIINGMNIDNEPALIKSAMGIVFQNSVLDKKLPVYENLKTKASLYGVTGTQFKSRLNQLSDRLQMEEIIKRPLGKLSGGQQRKVDIARALLHNPRILVLDEPTTGLDPKTRMFVWNCINDLRKKEGLTVFLTTHYMEEAAEAENVVILDRGKIVAADSPNGLKNAYAKDSIKVYSKGVLINTVIEKEGLTANEKEGYVEIQVDSTNTAGKLITKYSEVFSDFEVIKGKMDDVFLNVTGKVLEGESDHE